MVGRRRAAARDGQELQPKEINKALGFVRNACSTFAWPSPHLFTQLPPDASNSFDLSLLLSLRFFLILLLPRRLRTLSSRPSATQLPMDGGRPFDCHKSRRSIS